MTYTAFDPAKPTTASGTRQANVDGTRTNLMAVRDACIVGDFKGFNYSVSGGTAEQPAITYRKNGTEWLRATLTWGTSGGENGNVTVAVYAYSSDSGSNWSTIGTLTIAYDSNGNVTSTTWS
jgi:hypothetical protein